MANDIEVVFDGNWETVERAFGPASFSVILVQLACASDGFVKQNF